MSCRVVGFGLLGLLCGGLAPSLLMGGCLCSNEIPKLSPGIYVPLMAGRETDYRLEISPDLRLVETFVRDGKSYRIEYSAKFMHVE